MKKKNDIPALMSQYATLNAEMKTLEARMKNLKDEILYCMEWADERSVQTSYGTFTRAVRTTYTYSEAVLKIAERLKVAKTKEEQKGIAEPHETPYLLFTVARES